MAEEKKQAKSKIKESEKNKELDLLKKSLIDHIDFKFKAFEKKIDSELRPNLSSASSSSARSELFLKDFQNLIVKSFDALEKKLLADNKAIQTETAKVLNNIVNIIDKLTKKD